MTPSKLRELAEAKSARELAEDKPGTQHREPWRNLLDAMVEAMTGEQREAVAQKLGWPVPRQSIAERNQYTVGDAIGLRRRTIADVVSDKLSLCDELYDGRCTLQQWADRYSRLRYESVDP